MKFTLPQHTTHIQLFFFASFQKHTVHWPNCRCVRWCMSMSLSMLIWCSLFGNRRHTKYITHLIEIWISLAKYCLPPYAVVCIACSLWWTIRRPTEWWCSSSSDSHQYSIHGSFFFLARNHFDYFITFIRVVEHGHTVWNCLNWTKFGYAL